MDCSTAESMVTRYIDHTLNVDETEKFLNHVAKCSSCYDELETYFIVHRAMRQLDAEDKDTVLDFRELLEEDINRSRICVRKEKFARAAIAFWFCLLILGLIILLIYVLTTMI